MNRSSNLEMRISEIKRPEESVVNLGESASSQKNSTMSTRSKEITIPYRTNQHSLVAYTTAIISEEAVLEDLEYHNKGQSIADGIEKFLRYEGNVEEIHFLMVAVH